MFETYKPIFVNLKPMFELKTHDRDFQQTYVCRLIVHLACHRVASDESVPIHRKSPKTAAENNICACNIKKIIQTIYSRTSMARTPLGP